MFDGRGQKTKRKVFKMEFWSDAVIRIDDIFRKRCHLN